ncbi:MULTISPECIES: hypothetical protein [unclassified Streptomyces]|uniref:hypothetical protein n=1 Tax=unclassified Streptomyces TaxID=2593676 RepID=UPI003418A171
MDRIVDLDLAAAEIEHRRAGWAAAGLQAGPTTWRDEAAPWPQPFETDRTRVQDPDSIGVRIVRAAEAELEITLFRGAWADVGFGSEETGWEPVCECPYPQNAAEFGAVLDTYVSRAFSTKAVAEE